MTGAWGLTQKLGRLFFLLPDNDELSEFVASTIKREEKAMRYKRREEATGRVVGEKEGREDKSGLPSSLSFLS